MDNATAGIAYMNMVLHDQATATISRENTLSTPLFRENDRLKTFDFVVANPPFSFKAWKNGIKTPDEFGRFIDFGTPPDKNGDYAFLLHIIHSLKTTGKGACILPHGILFRGNAEAVIRTNIIRRGYIKAIIGLPANLFYGTGIPACIIILDKENANNRKGIFMIDASKGYKKDGDKNRLREQDIHRIVDVFERMVDIPRYSRMVSVEEIEKNDFNLNIPRYIDSQEPEDRQDIDAHLQGGIPTDDIDDLSDYWDVYPSLRTTLFVKGVREGYATLRVSRDDIRHTIFHHDEYIKYKKEVETSLNIWKEKSVTLLKNLTLGMKPKDIIHTISEDILIVFGRVRLIDPYDLYEHVMDYWADTMQDDLYIIVTAGWIEGARPRELQPIRDAKGKAVYAEQHDYMVNKIRYKSDLVPIDILIDRYYADEKKAIEELRSELDSITQALTELLEEHGGEDGYLASTDDISARARELKKAPDSTEELAILTQYTQLTDTESSLKKKLNHPALKVRGFGERAESPSTISASTPV